MSRISKLIKEVTGREPLPVAQQGRSVRYNKINPNQSEWTDKDWDKMGKIQSDLDYYVGSGYYPINNYLRGDENKVKSVFAFEDGNKGIKYDVVYALEVLEDNPPNSQPVTYTINDLNKKGFTDIPLPMPEQDIPIYKEQLEHLKDNLDFYLNNPRYDVERIFQEKRIPEMKQQTVKTYQALNQLPKLQDNPNQKAVKGLSFNTEDQRNAFLNNMQMYDDGSQWIEYYQEPSFTSVTTKSDVASEFANGDYPVQINYDISEYAPFKTTNFEEAESIFLPDTYFELLDKTIDNTGFVTMDVKALPAHPRAMALAEKFKTRPMVNLPNQIGSLPIAS